MKFFQFLGVCLLYAFNAEARDVYYNFNVSYFCGAPDGVYVCHILGINNQFPGPTIEAHIGDTLHITVSNHIQNQEKLQQTTLHWHGILQNGTPFQDGPDMVTQCRIPLNHTQTYVFPLNQAGTYWYHSHVHWQYTEGLWGPLIIHNKPEVYGKDYDEELTILLSDWYHTSGVINTDWFLSPLSGGSEPIPFSGLMNGRGTYPCNSTELPCYPHLQKPPVFNVEQGKRYRIRVINSSAFAKFYFSISDHILEVIETDGVDTVKVAVDKVPIAPAQRYSFIVKMNGQKTEYDIKAEIDLGMFGFGSPNINPNPDALVALVKGKLKYVNSNGEDIDDNDLIQWDQPLSIDNVDYKFNQTLLRPYDKVLAPACYDQQIVLEVDIVVDAQDISHLTFNNITYTSANVPLLALVKSNNPIPATVNPFTVQYNEVVQIVINNHDTGPHPFHLHGHTFFVMGYGAAGDGDYNAETNHIQRDGVRRDTVIVDTGSWAVLRFTADNPGVWFFHCHIDWHLQSGLAATIIEAPNLIRENLEVPEETKRICRAAGVTLP